MPAYQTYFDQLFLTLRISRPAFRTSAQFTYDAVSAANLGGPFPAALAALKTALEGFDENLQVRGTSTADDTEAQRTVRRQIVAFVDDLMIDLVKPRLRKLPAYKSFAGLKKSDFRRFRQDELHGQLNVLLGLLQTHTAALGPEPAAKAQALLDQWAAVTKERNEGQQEIDQTIQDLAQDWMALARALRRLQLLLLLQFVDEPDGGAARAYAFFDFSAARVRRNKKDDALAA